MRSSIIIGDPAKAKTEYAVVLPDGSIVTSSFAVPTTTYDDDRIIQVDDLEGAWKLANIYNKHYSRVGVPQDAKPVSRMVTTTYSDWAEV